MISQKKKKKEKQSDILGTFNLLLSAQCWKCNFMIRHLKMFPSCVTHSSQNAVAAAQGAAEAL